MIKRNNTRHAQKFHPFSPNLSGTYLKKILHARGFAESVKGSSFPQSRESEYHPDVNFLLCPMSITDKSLWFLNFWFFNDLLGFTTACSQGQCHAVLTSETIAAHQI